MIFAVLSILVALLLGFGAGQELIVRGVEGGEIQPFFIGLVGMVVSILIAIAGIALWRHWAAARPILVAAGIGSVVFHVYAALPPHGTVGVFALLLGAGYGLILLGFAFSSRARNAVVN